MSIFRDKVSRREAKRIIERATRVTHVYEGLSGGSKREEERQEVTSEELAIAFAAHPRWRMIYEASYTGPMRYIVTVPNQYAYERYIVESE